MRALRLILPCVALVTLVPFLGCAHAEPRPRRVAPETERVPLASEPPPSPSGAAGAARAAGAPERAPDERDEPAVYDAMAFEQLLDVPVRSIALGKAPKAAVLADAPYLFDGERLERRELPPAARGAPDGVEHVEIFFGRDNQPRLMGTRVTPDGATTSLYLRHRPAGWRPEPSELGPLAAARAGLYGLLGFSDPEVVCSPGLFCLVKRETGWARIDADAEATPMFLTGRGVYKAAGGALLRLEDASWKVVRAGFALEPTSLCERTETELWMTAEGTLFVHASPDTPLSTPATPVRSPRAIHCAAVDSVWVVGESGAAHFDGAAWQVVPGDLGALHHVTGRGTDEIWLGGERGVFRGRARAPSAGEAASPR